MKLTSIHMKARNTHISQLKKVGFYEQKNNYYLKNKIMNRKTIIVLKLFDFTWEASLYICLYIFIIKTMKSNSFTLKNQL